MPNDHADDAQLPVRCFLSYARADDAEYEFIAPMKKTLEHLCFSDSGRRVEVFVDRTSIGWGENWREKIADSLENATVFIPVISLQFFTREACRAELQAFHAAAKAIGLTELILPLIVFGKDRITADSDDPLTRMVEELQHIDIQEAVLSGPGTREWRTTFLGVARRLIKAVEQAEASIQDRHLARSAGLSGSIESVEDDDLGLYELDSRLMAGVGSLATASTTLIAGLDEVAKLVNQSAAKLKGATPEVVKSEAAALARDIEQAALDIHRLGGEIETTVSVLDADLRRYYSLVMQFGTVEMRERARDDVAGFGKEFSEIRVVMDAISEFIEQTRPFEVLSAPLRKSIRPLRAGVGSVHVAMATMESWTRLGKA